MSQVETELTLIYFFYEFNVHRSYYFLTLSDTLSSFNIVNPALLILLFMHEFPLASTQLLKEINLLEIQFQIERSCRENAEAVAVKVGPIIRPVTGKGF